MMKHEKMQFHRYLPGIAIAAAFLFAAPVGKATPIIVFSLEPVTVGAGTTGDTFDVIATNNTAGTVNIGGFAFGITTTSSNLTFTGVHISTAPEPYIFAGNSSFGPDISVQPPGLPGQTVEAEDLPNSGFTSFAAGTSEGLGLVTFSVSAGTSPGLIAVTFVSLDDSLTDPSGSPIPFSVTNGNITVSGVTTPEPATGALAGLALFAIIAGCFGRRRTSSSAIR
jgi:hypothetical protein